MISNAHSAVKSSARPTPGGFGESGYGIMCAMEKKVIDTHSFTGIGEGAFK